MTVVAVDVGGTHLRAATVRDHVIIEHAEAPTARCTVDVDVARLVDELLTRSPQPSLTAVGVGLPEYVRHGQVTSRDVVDWRPDALARVTAEAVGRPVPVVIESDVRCGALAEHALLDSPARQSLLYISWGTGVSSTLVLPGGDVWTGARGEAIAVGEWQDDDGCRLEDIASGGGIERSYARSTAVALDAQAIHMRAKTGDETASRLFERAGRTLGRAICALVDVMDPHAVVLGGGLGTSDQLGRQALFAELSNGDHRWGFPRVQPARLGADAGLIGAAIVAERADIR